LLREVPGIEIPGWKRQTRLRGFTLQPAQAGFVTTAGYFNARSATL